MVESPGPDYGFVLCRVRTREDVSALENALCGKTNVYTTGVTLPFDDGVIDRLGSVMRERWPGVRIEPCDIQRIARERGMSETEVVQSMTLVEMFVPGDGTDAYFEVFADHAQVSIPYSHRPPRVDIALLRVWEYLEALEQHLDCVTFDPQLRRVVALARDFQHVKTRYEYLAQRSASPQNGQARRWWKPW